MIKKWRVTPAQTTVCTNVSDLSGDGRRSRDDNEAVNRPSEERRTTRKNRRHTTGGTKETMEDICQAKQLVNAEMNGKHVVNKIDQEIDPNSTLGRKQLIAMLKQRYGPEIENQRKASELSEKEKVRRDRQRERDRRHEQRMKQQQQQYLGNRENNQNSDVHHTSMNNRNNIYRPILNSHGGSDDSEETDNLTTRPKGNGKMEIGNPRYESITYLQSSDDDSRNNERYHGSTQKPKEVVFLQYRDEVKRIQLQQAVKSVDVVKDLFVNAFPTKVTMSQLEEGLKSIYIKDMETSVYYQLEDVTDIVNRCFLKIQEHDTFSDTQSEFSAYNFRTKTLPGHGIHPKYTDSSHDYYSQPSAMPKRLNSQDSIQSEALNLSKKSVLDIDEDDPYSYINDEEAVIQNEQGHADGGDSFSLYLKKNEQPTDYPGNINDQLDDLTDLLNTALTEDDKYYQRGTKEVDIKNPGKLDRYLIDNLQHKTESNAKKKAIPRHFQPTAIVKAQQEVDRKTPDQGFRQTPAPNSPKKTSVTVFVTSRKVDNKLEEPMEKENPYAVPDKSNLENGFNAKQRHFEQLREVSAGKTANTKDLQLPIQAAYSPSKTIDAAKTSIKNNDLELKYKNSKHKQENENYTSQIADELLSQLIDLEEEVKVQSSSSSSRSSSFRNRLDSNASNGSKCSSTGSTSVKTGNQNPITKEAESRIRGASFPSEQYSPLQNPSKYRTMTVEVDNNSLPVYATVNKSPKHEIRSKSHTTTTFDASPIKEGSTDDITDGEVFENITPKSSPNDSTQQPQIKQYQPTRQFCQKPSIAAPNFIELDETARCVRRSITDLRNDLKNLRKAHVDNTKNFKADLQKKLLEFRKKASRVDEHLQQRLDMNNNFIFANQHPVRERRHRLTADQIEYDNKVEDSKEKLLALESEMELLRIDVVNKKRVENPDDLDAVHEELTAVTRAIAELKNRYHGLHDMLEVVMTSEMEVIKTEKQFMMNEPKRIEEFITRCKTLSATLFTLQKLASVQNVAQVNPSQEKKNQHHGAGARY